MTPVKQSDFQMFDDAILISTIGLLGITEMVDAQGFCSANYISFIHVVTLLSRVLAIISFSWTIYHRVKVYIRRKNGNTN